MNERLNGHIGSLYSKGCFNARTTCVKGKEESSTKYLNRRHQQTSVPGNLNYHCSVQTSLLISQICPLESENAANMVMKMSIVLRCISSLNY